jgi:hypothetical protein
VERGVFSAFAMEMEERGFGEKLREEKGDLAALWESKF